MNGRIRDLKVQHENATLSDSDKTAIVSEVKQLAGEIYEIADKTGYHLEAMQKIAANGALFVSRGDNSGTHQLELKLWQDAGVVGRHDAGVIRQPAGSGGPGDSRVAAGRRWRYRGAPRFSAARLLNRDLT